MKQILLTIVMMLVLVSPVHSAAEDDLKLAHKMLGEAAKTTNIDMLVPMIHPQALGFMRESQMVTQLGSGYGAREMLPPLLADLSRFLITPYETVYRVIGETGIVCMTVNATPVANDPKTNKKGQPRYNRAMYIYTKTPTGWKLLAWHTSETPLKKQ